MQAVNLKKRTGKINFWEKITYKSVMGVLKNELFEGLKSKCSINFPIDVEHVWNLPELFHIHFHTSYYRLIVTVDTNTLLSALATIPKALAIFFLAMDSIASTRCNFGILRDDRNSCTLLLLAYGLFSIKY